MATLTCIYIGCAILVDCVWDAVECMEMTGSLVNLPRDIRSRLAVGTYLSTAGWWASFV